MFDILYFLFLSVIALPCTTPFALLGPRTHHFSNHPQKRRGLPYDGSRSGDMTICKMAEPSRMEDYVSKFLGKDTSIRSDGVEDPLHWATHLVAIPLDSNHELLLELESVQRAILYHCPILLDSCIPGAATRLPLLYVNAGSTKTATATQQLAKILQSLVVSNFFQPVSDLIDADEQQDLDLVNEDGLQPLTMTFESLEIDGSNNNVLMTVGNDKTKRLQNFVHDLVKAVEQQGWGAVLPLDPNSKKDENEFRPRVPFMELPKSFNDNINNMKHEETEIDEEDFPFLSSEEGGNGISPIFWCQWWEDVFARNTRLKEIGIYPRSQTELMPSDLSYLLFHLAYQRILLPDATSSAIKKEQDYLKYDQQRQQEQEKALEEDILPPPSNAPPPNGTGKRIAAQADVDTTPVMEVPADFLLEVEQEEMNELSQGKDIFEDTIASRIKRAIESQESEKADNPIKKEVPPIEVNPVFKAYKEGTLTPPAAVTKSKTTNDDKYPAASYFAGIWRVDSSPTGFRVEENTDASSENLILRIDGSVAGGPILDKETRQKASGGSWEIIEGESGSVSLRIKLIIPPKKERVLEMFGDVDRLAVTDVPMTSRAFGMPHLEELAKKSISADGDAMMMCSGRVYIDNADDSSDRERIGEFAISKVRGLKDRKDYTISVPKPVKPF